MQELQQQKKTDATAKDNARNLISDCNLTKKKKKKIRNKETLTL